MVRVTVIALVEAELDRVLDRLLLVATELEVKAGERYEVDIVEPDVTLVFVPRTDEELIALNVLIDCNVNAFYKLAEADNVLLVDVCVDICVVTALVDFVDVDKVT